MALSHIYTPRRDRRTTRRSIRGIDMAINEWGDPDQPLLVFLHGFLDCGSTFQFVVDRLGRDWYVVAPDLRGFGGSHGPVSGFWFPDYLADLDSLLSEISPDTAVRLAGHSMGANIAGLYAGVFPDRVCAFINMEGFGLPDSDPGDAPARYRQWIRSARSLDGFSRYPNFAALADRVIARNPSMDRPAAEYVARCWGRETNGGIALRADPRHRLRNPVLYRRAEAQACWRAVRADVLLMAGSDSEFAAGANAEIGVGGLELPFPRASLQVIEGAGHMLHFEAPGPVAAAIDGFLGQYL